MKEKLIRKVYHFQGILDGIAILWIVSITVFEWSRQSKKPLHEQVKERKEIH